MNSCCNLRIIQLKIPSAMRHRSPGNWVLFVSFKNICLKNTMIFKAKDERRPLVFITQIKQSHSSCPQNKQTKNTFAIMHNYRNLKNTCDMRKVFSAFLGSHMPCFKCSVNSICYLTFDKYNL